MNGMTFVLIMVYKIKKSNESKVVLRILISFFYFLFFSSLLFFLSK
jgi:hypothetical protein